MKKLNIPVLMQILSAVILVLTTLVCLSMFVYLISGVIWLVSEAEPPEALGEFFAALTGILFDRHMVFVILAAALACLALCLVFRRKHGVPAAAITASAVSAAAALALMFMFYFISSYFSA